MLKKNACGVVNSEKHSRKESQTRVLCVTRPLYYNYETKEVENCV